MLFSEFGPCLDREVREVHLCPTEFLPIHKINLTLAKPRTVVFVMLWFGRYVQCYKQGFCFENIPRVAAASTRLRAGSLFPAGVAQKQSKPRALPTVSCLLATTPVGEGLSCPPLYLEAVNMHSNQQLSSSNCSRKTRDKL